MRITNSLFYTNTTNDYQRNMQELYKVNQQIASGTKIQNSFEDSGVYVDTMRLNYEVATLEQIKEGTSKAQTFANNTDNVLNQFNDSLNQFKTKMIQASSQVHSATSLDAIANELDSLREHMITLGNTSINGQFLFSGSALSVKPISADGSYKGNGENIETLIGSGVKLPFNIDGESLFLGTDSDYSRILSTNVQMFNQSELHPDIMVSDSGVTASKEVYLTEHDTIRDLVGDFDNDSTNDPNAMFYVSGRKPNGDTFSSKIEMGSGEKISELLEKVGSKFGNTPTNTVVDVRMNEHGQIEVKDLRNGNQQIEMNIFGAVDRNAPSGTTGDADKMTVDLLMGEDNVQIIEFQKSNFKSANTVSSTSSKQDIFTPGQFTLGAPMLKTDGTPANTSTTLQSFMGTEINQINFAGANNAGTAITDTLTITSSTTVQDLLNKVSTVYGTSARLEDGQIYLSSGNSTDFTLNQLNVNLTSIDSVGVAEVQSFEIKEDALGAGQMTVAGNLLPTPFVAGATPTIIAAQIVSDITTAGFPYADINGNNITSISSIGGKVTMTYDVADGDVPNINVTSTLASLNLGANVITETQYAPSRVVDAFSTFDGMNYERRGFEKDGNTLSSNISQIVKSTDAFATSSTKLSEVSGLDPFNDTILEFNFTNKNGEMSKGQINLLDAGTTFQIDYDNSGTYEPNETIPLLNINSDGVTTTQTKRDDVTYQQLMDVLSLALTGTQPLDLDSFDSTGTYVPADGDIFPEYKVALETARSIADISLDGKGKLVVVDKKQTDTKMELSLFDSRSDSFALSTDTAAFSFMANDAIRIEDPTVDFYKELGDMVNAVKRGEYQMDADNENPRNIGLNNSLDKITQLMDHIQKHQTKIGSYSNSLSNAHERSTLLSINVQTVRSEIIDVDIGEAYMKFNQISNSYQAMLSTIAKINSMSLLNYM